MWEGNGPRLGRGFGKVHRSRRCGAGFGREGVKGIDVVGGVIAVRAEEDTGGGSGVEDGMAARGCRKETRV